MMLIRNNLFDDFFGDMFDDPFFNRGYVPQNQLMKTDIRERDGQYLLEIEVPGYTREDVKAELKDGYLVITASTNQNNDEKDAQGRYLRRERYSGSCSRSFYVGEDLTQEDIKAKFEHGTLKLMVPNKENRPKVEETRHITIEG